MTERNIFTATSRYAYRQGENFLTESLAFVLDILREREPQALQKFLMELTGVSLEIEPNNLVITTQESTEQGRPDLAISQKLDLLLYIEIKNHSELGWNQLERYHEELGKREEAYKLLFLLTRSREGARQVSLDRDQFSHILWHQVAGWLRVLQLREDVARYIVQSYIMFLEDSQMSLIQVKNYADGVIHMRRMVDLIRLALGETLPNEKVAYTSPFNNPSIGYFWQKDQNWLGFYFDKPAVLFIEKGGDAEPRPKCSLDLEEMNFFEMESGDQLDTLIRFISESVDKLDIPQSPAV